MLLVSLYPYDPIADSVGSGVMLRMRDEDVKAILAKLELAGTESVRVRLHAASKAGGQPHEVELFWRRECAAFSCMVDGRQAGLLTYDELSGSLGKAVPEQARTCRVCLSAELDIWRSGIMDVATGSVHVYTQSKGLASIGAHAYFTADDAAPSLDGLFLELDPGEPATGSLRVPSYALHSIQDAAFPRPKPAAFDAQQSLDKLSELGKTLSAFQSNVRGSKPTLG